MAPISSRAQAAALRRAPDPGSPGRTGTSTIFTLRLLRSFELRRADELVSLPISTQRLVAFLALRAGPLRRLHVAGTLWIDASEEHANACLRTALWRLKRLTATMVAVTSTHLAFSDTVVVDVHDAARRWVGDLEIELRSPAGTVVRLFNRHGSSGDNFVDTVFDDEAVTSITTASAPFTGSFIPFMSLSAFDGQPTLGTWKLIVRDRAAATSGRSTAGASSAGCTPAPSALLVRSPLTLARRSLRSCPASMVWSPWPANTTSNRTSLESARRERRSTLRRAPNGDSAARALEVSGTRLLAGAARRTASP